MSDFSGYYVGGQFESLRVAKNTTDYADVTVHFLGGSARLQVRTADEAYTVLQGLKPGAEILCQVTAPRLVKGKNGEWLPPALVRAVFDLSGGDGPTA